MLTRPWIIAALSAAALAVASCRSYDTDPRDPPDQPPATEETGTGGSGSSNTNDAAGADEGFSRGEDLEDEAEEQPANEDRREFDPSAVR